MEYINDEVLTNKSVVVAVLDPGNGDLDLSEQEVEFIR
jgi:hypothetical protein